MHEIGPNYSKTHKTIFAIFKKTKNSNPISRIITDLKIVLKLTPQIHQESVIIYSMTSC